MLVFEDSKVRDAFDHRSRVRSTGRHNQGGDFLSVRVEFHFAWFWCGMHHGFEDNKGARYLRCARQIRNTSTLGTTSYKSLYSGEGSTLSP